MPVDVIEVHPGYSLACGMKLQEMEPEYEILRSKFRDFINNNIIAVGYPELQGKVVTSVWENGKLTLHVSTPDEVAAPQAEDQAAPQETMQVAEGGPMEAQASEAVPTQASDETQVTN